MATRKEILKTIEEKERYLTTKRTELLKAHEEKGKLTFRCENLNDTHDADGLTEEALKNNEVLSEINNEIEKTQNEIKELQEELNKKETEEEPKGEVTMSNQNYIERTDVKQFLTRIRELPVTRSFKGAELGIPEVLLDTVRTNVEKYSKLLPLVDYRKIIGQGRLHVVGNIPESVWTEACAKLNELDFKISTIELDGYKVGGYVAICKATLDDATDLDLYNLISDLIGESIGQTLDQAIVYGTGKKMPLGIVTRLMEETAVEPDRYNKEWENLKADFVYKKDKVTPLGDKAQDQLIQYLYTVFNVAKPYKNSGKVVMMNNMTYGKIAGALASINGMGHLVSAVGDDGMLAGTKVIILPFMPNDAFLFGYPKAYLLVERQGVEIESSDQVQFIEGNVLFKGTARYDGAPIEPKSFVYFGLDTEPPKTITFKEDTANKAEL